tara:strand:+ start:12791 stop:13030 length:240 start_codon:yes stop_codon:yes gene_type:complete
MKRIFVNGNYVIIDDNATVTPFAKKVCYYDEVESGVLIFVGSKTVLIETDDIPNWFDESMRTAFTFETLVEFLRLNTGI